VVAATTPPLRLGAGFVLYGCCTPGHRAGADQASALLGRWYPESMSSRLLLVGPAVVTTPAGLSRVRALPVRQAPLTCLTWTLRLQ